MTESIVIRIVVEPSGRLHVDGQNCPLPVMIGTIEMAKQALITGAMVGPPTLVQSPDAPPSLAGRVPGFAPIKVA